MNSRTLALFAALTLAGACSSSDAPAPADASAADAPEGAVDTDAARDSGADVGTDAAVDRPLDAATDATVDARVDAAADAAKDGPVTAGEGESCGGFVVHPTRCATGLVCVAAVSDRPGICHRACPDGSGCAAGTTCADGACVPPRPCTLSCVRGRQNCGSDCCVDVQTDARHCGDCATACPDGRACTAGVCAP
jgi:hypothetical protein